MPYINLFISDELHDLLKKQAKEAALPLYRLIPGLLEAQVQAPQVIEKPEPTTQEEDVDLFGFGSPRPAPKPTRGRRVRS